LEHAVVRVYDTRSYKVFGEPLQGHILTVTRISFSPDDKLILTVSRDRTWRLFETQSENGKYTIICYCYCLQYSKTPGSGYIPIAAEKAHTRIIWDCGWAIEGDVFATASRDKTVY
jgi:elongator complex protein 2